MKKGLIGALTMMLAATNQNSLSEGIPYLPNPSARLDYTKMGVRKYSSSVGNDPKSYGQWLQQAGRQKWVKAKRK